MFHYASLGAAAPAFCVNSQWFIYNAEMLRSVWITISEKKIFTGMQQTFLLSLVYSASVITCTVSLSCDLFFFFGVIVFQLLAATSSFPWKLISVIYLIIKQFYKSSVHLKSISDVMNWYMTAVRKQTEYKSHNSLHCFTQHSDPR